MTHTHTHPLPVGKSPSTGTVSSLKAAIAVAITANGGTTAQRATADPGNDEEEAPSLRQGPLVLKTRPALWIGELGSDGWNCPFAVYAPDSGRLGRGGGDWLRHGCHVS